MLRGILLASFQNHEHEGGDTRSQGGITDNDSKIKDPRSQHAYDLSKKFPRTQGSNDGNDKVITFLVQDLCGSSDPAALKQANFDLTVAGDHRKVQLNELNELRDHAYENSLIYKEKTKRIHDFKIKNRVFNVGDRVLLFNSRLKIFSGKLKTYWSGPFTIAKVFSYGTVELSQANGPNFKVNSHRVKHYFGGDVPQLDCSDCEVFHALSFVLHPQELHILSIILGIPAEDGVIISIPPLVGGVADVVVEIKGTGWSISISFRFSVGLQTPDDLSRSRLGFIEKMGVHGCSTLRVLILENIILVIDKQERTNSERNRTKTGSVEKPGSVKDQSQSRKQKREENTKSRDPYWKFLEVVLIQNKDKD
nr:reverse transcriptase domain-containing protein [Tanacetum cinerariifolium]